MRSSRFWMKSARGRFRAAALHSGGFQALLSLRLHLPCQPQAPGEILQGLDTFWWRIPLASSGHRPGMPLSSLLRRGQLPQHSVTQLKTSILPQVRSSGSVGTGEVETNTVVCANNKSLRLILWLGLKKINFSMNLTSSINSIEQKH